MKVWYENCPYASIEMLLKFLQQNGATCESVLEDYIPNLYYVYL